MKADLHLLEGRPSAGGVSVGAELRLWSLGGAELCPHGASTPRTPRTLSSVLQELEQKKEQQKKIQAEIKRINDENQRCKEEQLQKERMEDERVLEYQRQKMVLGLSTAARRGDGVQGGATKLCPT